MEQDRNYGRIYLNNREIDPECGIVASKLEICRGMISTRVFVGIFTYFEIVFTVIVTIK